MRFTETASENGEVLRVGEDCASINGSLAGDNAVSVDLVGLTVHAEVRASVHYESIVFLEGSNIEQ